MKKFIILLIFPILMTGCCNNTQQAVSSVSQADVTAALDQLWKAMITADENLLKSITADELVYGHSGGKVQNKDEFIAEVLSGEPLVYLSIEPLDQTIKLAGDAAIVRHIFTSVTRLADGSPGSLRVGNTLVWKLQDGKLKLLVRQAYRLPDA